MPTTKTRTPDVVEGDVEESFGKGLRDAVAVGLGVLLEEDGVAVQLRSAPCCRTTSFVMT